jgi:hypothetical protein
VCDITCSRARRRRTRREFFTEPVENFVENFRG